jgi:glycosyltransferase involved in cell wall biosynthesis
MAPDISVIIPTIHRHTVFRALNSIAAQRPAGFALEVFVIHDGQVPFAARDFSPYSFPVHALGLLPSQGAAGTRNVGVQFAAGRFLAFLDDDDEWLPNHLSTILPVIRETGGIVYTDAELYHLEEGWHHPFRFSYQPAMLTKTSPVIPSTMAAERGVFEKIGYFDTAIPAYSDWDWILRASQHDVAITRIPLITANYYFSDLSTSSHPEAMAPQLRLLQQKHHLGAVPVASFAKMMTDPWFARWRLPG